MDIRPELLREIGGAGRKVIVVPGRDEHRTADGGEKRLERLERIAINSRAVKQVARQQHQVAPLGIGRERFERDALLGAALRRLLRREGGKARIQMEIARLQYSNHAPPPFLRSGSDRFRRQR